MKITNIRINGIENPTGFAYEHIICSWNVQDTKSRRQTGVKIQVGSDANLHTILYEKEGKELDQSGERLELELKPRTTYYYQITVEGDAKDRAVSDIGTFETGKMKEKWAADWIGTADEDTFHPLLTRKFTVDKKVKRARLYASGVGLFEAGIDGRKLGEEYLMPYVSNYEENIQTMTFPVEECFGEEQGQEHTLEILLGKGWYMGTFGLDMQNNNYGSRMAAIAELHLEYEDGSKECIVTDKNWKYYGSDIEDSGIYFGEIYNRQLWLGQENQQKSVRVLEHPEESEGTGNLVKEHLMDRISLPVLAKERMEVSEIIYTPAGEIVLDMGQNFAGFMEFEADFLPGTKIVLDFGEILQEGNFYNKNYRDAKSQFVYISNGEKETVRPHFTFYGFRYVRVSGWPGVIQKSDFTGFALYSDIRRTGHVTTGNAKINRLYENTVWGLKSNFIDMPTDCPQRSERLGWTGDAQVFAPTASYHMDTRAFFHKFVKDLQDEQKFLNGGVPNYLPNMGHKEDVGSVWGDIATFLPNTLYTYYGNLEEMEYCYPLMKNWVDYIDRKDEERGGRQFLFNFGFHFGDWLALDGPTPTSFKGSTDDDYIASVYYYRSVQLVKEAAQHLGNEKDAEKYAVLEERIAQAVFREFFTPSGRLAVDTQAAYVIALKFGMYIDRDKTIGQFKSRLKKDCNQIKCGFVGAPLLCTVLAEAGLYELAYDFLLKEGFPSWLYSVNLGATTIWERWNSVLPDGTISDTGMNSLNHYAYGSVMEFVYAYAAGIRPLEPGFKKAVIEPHPDIRLGKLDCQYDSVNGTYVSRWSIEADGTIRLHVEIPFSCEAEVVLPGNTKERQILGAGSYDFVYEPENDFRKPYHKGTTLARIAQDEKALEVLGKYVPAIAGIAASGDPEMGAASLEEIAHMGYLPFEPKQLEKAIEEISELQVVISEDK